MRGLEKPMAHKDSVIFQVGGHRGHRGHDNQSENLTTTSYVGIYEKHLRKMCEEDSLKVYQTVHVYIP